MADSMLSIKLDHCDDTLAKLKGSMSAMLLSDSGVKIQSNSFVIKEQKKINEELEL